MSDKIKLSALRKITESIIEAERKSAPAARRWYEVIENE